MLKLLNIYQVSLSELFDAYCKCRLHKRNSNAALSFELNLEDNLIQLRDEINSGKYKISASIAFIVEYPVKREIFAADFRDRIVHHLIINRLIPYFEKEFIFDSYACRPCRGTLFGIKRLRRFIAKCSNNYTCDCYVLKCDIQGFFMNIDRDILWLQLKKFVNKIDFKDSINTSEDLFGMYCKNEVVSPIREFLLNLLHTISLHDSTQDCRINGNRNLWDNLPYNKSLFGTNGKKMPNSKCCGVESNSSKKALKGIPIGNLTSQWFGNLYFNDFDHYMKSTLKVQYYGRYVDDFFVVSKDKNFLKQLIAKIETYLENNLKLKLHPNKLSICNYRHGVSFLGVVLKNRAILTGKRTKCNAKSLIYQTNKLVVKSNFGTEELERFVASVNSYLGLMKHHSSYKLRKSLLSKINCNIANRTTIGKSYLKIAIKNYTIAGNEMLPYFEY